jgi:hypothetical protein
MLTRFWNSFLLFKKYRHFLLFELTGRYGYDPPILFRSRAFFVLRTLSLFRAWQIFRCDICALASISGALEHVPVVAYAPKTARTTAFGSSTLSGPAI